jgi:hypothetical protein
MASTPWLLCYVLAQAVASNKEGVRQRAFQVFSRLCELQPQGEEPSTIAGGHRVNKARNETMVAMTTLCCSVVSRDEISL